MNISIPALGLNALNNLGPSQANGGPAAGAGAGMEQVAQVLATLLASLSAQGGTPMMAGGFGENGEMADAGLDNFLGGQADPSALGALTAVGGGLGMGSSLGGYLPCPSSPAIAPPSVSGAGSSSMASAPAAATSAGSISNGDGQSSVELARRFRGRLSQSIRGEMPNFTAAGGRTRNCADFVSSALESTGRLGGHEIGVSALEGRLRREGWRRTTYDQARPGDVAFFPNRQHVQLVSERGRQIGSNNGGRSYQTISEGRLARNAVIYTRG